MNIEDSDEIWKDIIGYEGMYQISNYGRIKTLSRKYKCSLVKEKIKTLNPNRNGYLQVSLCKYGKKKPYMVHRLVAKHFLKDFGEKLDVNHKDCNKTNNNVNNLEMVTRKQNIKHAWQNGLCENVRKASKRNVLIATKISLMKRRNKNE